VLVVVHVKDLQGSLRTCQQKEREALEDLSLCCNEIKCCLCLMFLFVFNILKLFFNNLFEFFHLF